MITVAVDGMGGDNAPACMVQGAVDAINKNSSIKAVSYTHLNKPFSVFYPFFRRKPRPP